MAPRRKPRTKPGQTRPFKIYLPEDVSRRIEQKSKDKGWPQNRVIIDELANYPRLEKIGELAGQVAYMRDVLARYSAHIVMHDFSEELLEAVDAVLETTLLGNQFAAIEKLRVVRNEMLKTKPP
jgi:hypothetical protein